MLSGVKLDDIRPNGFLLKKTRHGRYLDAYRMKPVRTDYFKNKLKSTLKTIHERYNTGEIKLEGMHEDTEDDAVVVWDVNEYQTVRSTIEQIFQHADAQQLGSLKSVTGAKFSAMLFDIPDGKSVIAIDSISIFSKAAFERGLFVATYDETALEELKQESVLVFEYGLPCIYFEEENMMLVLDKQKTEKIFNLLEHYQKNATKKFGKLVDEDIIEIDSDVLNSELRNITTARKINNMIKMDSFTKDIDYYKEYENKSLDFDDERTRITIQNDKVIISNKDDLRSFLHITRDDVVESMMDNDKKFIAFKKRPIKRKQNSASTN